MHLAKSKRGSILLVTLLLAGVIVLVLGNYISIASSALEMSNRSLYSNAANNLADSGLDRVFWVANYGTRDLNGNIDWANNGFTSVTVNATPGYQCTYDYSSGYLSNGVGGKVYVWVNPAVSVPLSSGGNENGIQVIAKAVITPPTTSIYSPKSAIVKEAMVYMLPSSLYPGSLVGKDAVSVAGTINSYNSNKGAYGATLTGGGTNINANADVGSPDIITNAVAINDAKVAGNALTGESALSAGDLTTGNHGSVGDANWVANNTGLETGHVTYNFTTSFPDAKTPSPTTINSISSISGATTLPGAGDHSVPVTSNGVTTTYYFYQVSGSISLSGNGDVLSIAGSSSSNHVNVVLIFPNTNPTQSNASVSASDISISGKGQIDIASGSTLTVYAPGTIDIQGNGIANGGAADSSVNPPAAFQVYGTETSGQASSSGKNQSITIAGNGVLSGAVYAPNATISMKGGGSSGEVLGAVVGNTVSINGGNSGNYPFHYDEALAALANPWGYWSAVKYRELFNATDQANWAAFLPSS